jgi:hypothetical protein
VLDPALGGGLVARLAEADGWDARLAALEEVLGGLDGGPAPDPEVAWAWRQLQRSGGGARIGELVRETGWSHRRFTRCGYADQSHLTRDVGRFAGCTPAALRDGVVPVVDFLQEHAGPTLLPSAP